MTQLHLFSNQITKVKTIVLCRVWLMNLFVFVNKHFSTTTFRSTTFTVYWDWKTFYEKRNQWEGKGSSITIDSNCCQTQFVTQPVPGGICWSRRLGGYIDSRWEVDATLKFGFIYFFRKYNFFFTLSFPKDRSKSDL